MAWEGVLPTVVMAGAIMAAGVGLDAIHKLSNSGRTRRIGRDGFDMGLDERDRRLVSHIFLVPMCSRSSQKIFLCFFFFLQLQEGVLKAGRVYGTNEDLLFGRSKQ